MHLKLFNRKNDKQNNILIHGMLTIEGCTITEIDAKGQYKQILSYTHTGVWLDSLGNEWTNFILQDDIPNENLWPDHAQIGIIDVQKDFMVEKDSGNHETFQRVFSLFDKKFMKGNNPLTESYSAFKPAHTCKNCGADLTKRNTVVREYVNKDDGPNRYGDGHYNEDGDFEPDRGVDLSDGRYDNVDGSDTCGNCGEVVG